MNENFVKNLQNQKFHQIFHQNKIHKQYFHTPINSPQEVKKIFAKPQFLISFLFTFCFCKIVSCADIYL